MTSQSLFFEGTMQHKQLVLHIDDATHKALAEDARREMRLVGRHALFLLRQDLIRRGLLSEVTPVKGADTAGESLITKA
jgi:hypothetical protein